ncbi:uncharacterized protein LOC142239648 [Haematobia irritans]|uniref:uncharacterized protein LOC142239648 n=1 Tax=Haematobia irritans TaxID=7368 RepID=UPI003F4F9DE6
MIASSILVVITLVLMAIYLWCRRTYSYWQRHGIPYVKPTMIIGNTKEAFSLKTSIGLHLSQLYNLPEMHDEPVIGIYMFHQPALVVRDPEIIKSILIKDFNLFNNRYGKCDPHGDVLGNSNLFFARNSYWKELRTKISPVFTSGKVKQMYPLMLEVTAQLEEYLSRQGNNFTTEVKEICALFTTDLISTIAFGINANSLTNPNGEFRVQCRKMFTFTLSRAFDFSMAFFLPKLVSLLRVKIFSSEFSKFLRSTINHVMSERERTGVPRNDLIDILVALKNEGGLSDVKNYQDCLVAQAAVFLTAGFETSSSTMAFALFELAKKPQLQERLRQEITEALVMEKNGFLSYEKIHSLEYLNMIVEETLRMYPVLPFLDRQHQRPSGIRKGFNLKPYYEYALPDKMPVYIPIYAIHRDPKYWPNPNEFDPERFSANNKNLNNNSMSYLPFGTGPHNCIGSRIGLLQTKLGLVHFLKNHRVQICDKTPVREEFDPKALVLQFEQGVSLNVVRDNLYNNMSKAFTMIFPLVVALLATCILIFILYSVLSTKHKLEYWKRHRIPYVKPLPLFGNLKDLFALKISFGELFQNFYENSDIRHCSVAGIYLFHKPALILRDPDLIKLIFIKHADKFQNRYEAADEEYDKMGSFSLPLSKFPIWWGCRKKMSQAFTSGQMKFRMYPLMVKVAQELEEFIQNKLQRAKIPEDGIIVEVKEMLALFTTDLTSVLHYGKDVKGLAHGHSVLREQTLLLFDISLRKLLDFFIIFFCPEWTTRLRAKVFSGAYRKFMLKFTKEILSERNQNICKNSIECDLIDILIKFQKEKQADPLHYSQHEEFIASQVAIFLLAGFETSSSVIGFILYELAKHHECQLKLRQELKQAFQSQSHLSYEDLQNLTYLQQVLCEGLRMYPAASFINRECTTKPLENGFQLTPELFIPHGMPVYVSILGLHRDPKHWQDPHNFNPDRFASHHLQHINSMIYQPFGVGPHSCIGSRLGLLQVKLALAHILSQYQVRMCSKTPKEIQFDPKSFMLAAKGGIYLKFIRDT